MTLRDTVESILADQKRTLTWLSGELNKTYTGFKLSLENETIKFSDLKRMLDVLKVPVTKLFHEKQYLIGESEQQVVASEPGNIYRKENDILRENIELLKNTIEDKNRIIELLSKK